VVKRETKTITRIFRSVHSLLLPSGCFDFAVINYISLLQFQLFIYLVSALAIIIRRAVCTHTGNGNGDGDGNGERRDFTLYIWRMDIYQYQ